MKITYIFGLILALSSTLTQSAAGSDRVRIAITFDQLSKGSLFYQFVNNPKKFEKSLGPDYSSAHGVSKPTKQQIARRVKFQQEVMHRKDKPLTLLWACAQSLPVCTTIITSTGQELNTWIFNVCKYAITPLCAASIKGDVAFVNKLISLGANVDFSGESTETPLHFALALGRTEALEALLKAGADPNKSRVDGVAPIHLAAGSGNIDAVKLLLKHKANIQARTSLGATPLFIAAEAGYTEIVKLLLNFHSKSEQIT